MSDRLVDRALPQWGLTGARTQLVARRENRVYRVDAPDGRRFALRLHRPDYRSGAELQSELDWLTALRHGGLRVPLPVASEENRLLHEIDGTRISLLTWLDGAAMGRTGEPLDIKDRPAVFRLGRRSHGPAARHIGCLETAGRFRALRLGRGRSHRR